MASAAADVQSRPLLVPLHTWVFPYTLLGCMVTTSGFAAVWQASEDQMTSPSASVTHTSFGRAPTSRLHAVLPVFAMRMAIVTGLPMAYDWASVVTDTESALFAQSAVVGVVLAAFVEDCEARALLVALSVVTLTAGADVSTAVGVGTAVCRCDSSALPMMARGMSTMSRATACRRR